MNRSATALAALACFPAGDTKTANIVAQQSAWLAAIQ
jgi:hypothetical protein